MKNYKRRLLILCIICITSITLVQGQKDTTKSKEPGVHVKFFFGPSYPIILMPSKTINFWCGQENSNVLNYYCNSKDLIGKFSTETGLLMDIQLYKKFFLSFGVTFNYINIQTKRNTVLNVVKYDNSSPLIWPNTDNRTYYIVNNIEIDQIYKFISGPVSLNYKFKDKKINSSLGIGISYDMLISYNLEGIAMPLLYDHNKYLYQKYYFSIFTNAEFNYVLEKSLSVGIAPYLKYFFYDSPGIIKVDNSNELKFLLIGAKLFIKF